MKNTKIDELQKQLDEATNNWKRALADYQNLEKRGQAEKEEIVRYANRELILKLLPVLDNLEKLVAHLKDDGAKLILNQFQDILRNVDVQRIDVIGKDFDPEEMECVDVVESNEENKVLEETRPGYRLKGKVIRPALVKVGKKKVEKKAEELAKDQLTKGDYM